VAPASLHAPVDCTVHGEPRPRHRDASGWCCADLVAIGQDVVSPWRPCSCNRVCHHGCERKLENGDGRMPTVQCDERQDLFASAGATAGALTCPLLDQKSGRPDCHCYDGRVAWDGRVVEHGRRGAGRGERRDGARPCLGMGRTHSAKLNVHRGVESATTGR
jgi:hypothetical protein